MPSKGDANAYPSAGAQERPSRTNASTPEKKKHAAREEEEEEDIEETDEGGSLPTPSAGIRRLLLTGNRLGDAGARALASALKRDESVEVLDLTRCGFVRMLSRCT